LSLQIDLQERPVQHEEERETNRYDEAQRRPDDRVDAERTDRHPLAAPRVATRWEEGLPQRVPGKALLEEDATKVRMSVELDAEHVVRLPLAPVRALPYRGECRNVRVEL